MFPTRDEFPEKYDFTMEVLCSLPREPVHIPVALLAEDFGLSGQALVRAAIARLQKRGILASLHHGERRGDGNQLWIERHGWRKAVDVGEKYWKKAYGA